MSFQSKLILYVLFSEFDEFAAVAMNHIGQFAIGFSINSSLSLILCCNHSVINLTVEYSEKTSATQEGSSKGNRDEDINYKADKDLW